MDEESMQIAVAQQHTDEAGVEKYRLAADIVNRTMAELISNCIGGASVRALCEEADGFINEEVAGLDLDGEHGNIPTCISANNCACYYCPTTDESDSELQPGDVIKITMGCFVDGHIAVLGHTHVVGIVDRPLTGRPADAVVAAHVAAEAVHRMFTPGLKSTDVSSALEKIAAMFKCNPVRSNFICSMSRFVLEGKKVVLNGEGVESPPPFEVEANEVYNVDIMMSTGRGKIRELEQKPTVYQRDLNNTKQLKTSYGRRVYSEITAHHPALPFTTRGFEAKDLLGLKECLRAKLLIPYATQYEKKGEYVAQVKFTLIVKEEGSLRLCSHPPPHVRTVHSISDPELSELLDSPAPHALKEGPTEPLPVNCSRADYAEFDVDGDEDDL